MRAPSASLCVLAGITVSACGGSTPAASPTVAAPAIRTATAPATPPPTHYRTRLERSLATAFRAAYFAIPPPPTESQVPPRLNLLVRAPPTVCTRQRPATYRCAVTYLPTTSARALRASYLLHRRGRCFTATAAAIATDSPLRRLRNC